MKKKLKERKTATEREIFALKKSLWHFVRKICRGAQTYHIVVYAPCR